MSQSPRGQQSATSIVDVIGNTPVLELTQVVERLGLRGRLLAKLENLNPGGSKKDRVARQMILEARASGALRPGQPVVELTSGNTGAGLALVCRALQHPFIAVMSRGNSVERVRIMRALGAEVVLVDQAGSSCANQVSGEDLAAVDREAERLVAERQAFRADQFELESNVSAHFTGTGPELWAQSGGSLDAFVDFVGSGGTFTGVSRYLRSVHPQVRCHPVEPAGAAVLSGRADTGGRHKIQGGGYGRRDLRLFDSSLVTSYLTVTDEEARESCRRLAEWEGVFGGYSSGANLAAAEQLLRGPEAGGTVAFLVCDTGLKYLSTDLYES